MTEGRGSFLAQDGSHPISHRASESPRWPQASSLKIAQGSGSLSSSAYRNRMGFSTTTRPTRQERRKKKEERRKKKEERGKKKEETQPACLMPWPRRHA